MNPANDRLYLWKGLRASEVNDGVNVQFLQQIQVNGCLLISKVQPIKDHIDPWTTLNAHVGHVAV